MKIKYMDITTIRHSLGLRGKLKYFPMYKQRKMIKSIIFLFCGTLFFLGLAFFLQVKILNRKSAEAALNKICEPRIIKEIIEKEKEIQEKEYSLEEPFNFKFSLPENWHILIDTNKKVPILPFTKAGIALSNKPIEISEDFVNYPISITISNQSLTYKERSFEKIASEKEKIVVSGITATSFSGVDSELNSKYKAIVLGKDKQVFVIYAILNLNGNDYSEVLDNLVKSIKFNS